SLENGRVDVGTAPGVPLPARLDLQGARRARSPRGQVVAGVDTELVLADIEVVVLDRLHRTDRLRVTPLAPGVAGVRPVAALHRVAGDRLVATVRGGAERDGCVPPRDAGGDACWLGGGRRPVVGAAQRPRAGVR